MKTAKVDKTHRFPDLDASDEEILGFKSRYFNYKSTFRWRHMERMALNSHYYLGRQWIEPDSAVGANSTGGYGFHDLRFASDDYYSFPRPVSNRIRPAVDVEMSALGMREMYPKVIANSKDPRIDAAAKIAQDILDDRLRKLNWADTRDQGTLLGIITGTSIIKSYWDADWQSTILIPRGGTVQCPDCGEVMADKAVSMPDFEGSGLKHLDTADAITTAEDPNPVMSMNHCPFCDSEAPLEPYQASDSDLGSSDKFGRTLGESRPKGNTGLEVVSPFDFFPDNGGVDTTPNTARFSGQVTPRPLDWIERYYPEMADEVSADANTADIYRYHPMLGDHGTDGSYVIGQNQAGEGIYDDYTRVWELYAEPSPRFPEGRSIVIASDKVLENGPLLLGEEVKVPKVKYCTARFMVRHREFWGQGLVDDLISPQNQYNGMKAQQVDARERMGSPNIIASEGMNLSGPEWFEGYGGGKILKYAVDPMSPNTVPQIFGGTMMPADIFQERQGLIEDMTYIAGPADVELGEAPRNITTTSGLQLLNEEAKRRRGTRERAISEQFRKVFEHQLQLCWALRVDPDEYEAESSEGTWEIKQYVKTQLEGQTKVQIEIQPYIEKSVIQKEAAREALADGLISLNGQASIKKMLEMMGLPTDINEDLNLQVDLAKRQWVDFIDSMEIPVIDTTLDDYRIHFQVLATLLLGDEGKKASKAINWPSIMELITGWEEQLQQAEMMDQQAVAFYGGRLSPEQAQPIFDEAVQNFELQTSIFEKQSLDQAQMAEVGAPPLAPAMPPQPPPPPVFLPASKSARILQVWAKMLQEKQYVPQAPLDEPALLSPQDMQGKVESFLKFRSVVEAYNLLAKEKEMQAVMGAPQVAAPGTPEGTPGMNGANPGLQAPGGQFNQPQNPISPPTPGTPRAQANQRQ